MCFCFENGQLNFDAYCMFVVSLNHALLGSVGIYIASHQQRAEAPIAYPRYWIENIAENPHGYPVKGEFS
jgi:hypothetical protein